MWFNSNNFHNLKVVHRKTDDSEYWIRKSIERKICYEFSIIIIIFAWVPSGIFL